MFCSFNYLLFYLYIKIYRRNSTSKNGWLDVRIGELGVWSRKWVVYDDCILYLSDEVTDRRDQVLLINMDNVISIRVDVCILNYNIKLIVF